MIFSQRLTDTAYFPGFRLRSTEEGDTWVWGELEPHGLSCSSGAGTACTTETSLPENSHLHAPRELKCPKITHSLWRRAFCRGLIDPGPFVGPMNSSHEGEP